MTKTELSEHYANQKVLANPRNAFTGYSWDTQKKLTTFDGYDIEQAYEDGFDKAVELTCQYIKDNLYKYLFVCDGQAGFPTAEFIKYLKSAMEEMV